MGTSARLHCGLISRRVRRPSGGPLSAVGGLESRNRRGRNGGLLLSCGLLPPPSYGVTASYRAVLPRIRGGRAVLIEVRGSMAEGRSFQLRSRITASVAVKPSKV